MRGGGGGFDTWPMDYNVRPMNDDPFSSFQAKSSSTSSVHASLLQVISGVMSLVLCQAL